MGSSLQEDGSFKKISSLFIPSWNTDQGVLQYEEYYGGKNHDAQWKWKGRGRGKTRLHSLRDFDLFEESQQNSYC